MYISVVPYDPNWIVEFEKESNKIKSMLGDVLDKINHIGSTAVPGLQAKPVIDIMLEVTSLDLLDGKAIDFENLAYEVKGELGIKGRRYYRKGGDNRTHQIHAFKSGDDNILRHLAFRDYLIAHKSIAEEYGFLKSKIAKTCNHDIEKYCDDKDPFIKEHEAKAMIWFKSMNS